MRENDGRAEKDVAAPTRHAGANFPVGAVRTITLFATKSE